MRRALPVLFFVIMISLLVQVHVLFFVCGFRALNRRSEWAGTRVELGSLVEFEIFLQKLNQILQKSFTRGLSPRRGASSSASRSRRRRRQWRTVRRKNNGLPRAPMSAQVQNSLQKDEA